MEIEHLISPLAKYRSYVDRLRQLALSDWSFPENESECKIALNGGASEELRQIISIELQREMGAFFTGSDLSNRLLLNMDLTMEKRIYDPCCGMGDLLLSAANRINLKSTVNETLLSWGQHLSGTDLHQEFIEGTKARLVILARIKHGATVISPLNYDELFPYVYVSDSLFEENLFRQASMIVLNPPFGKSLIPTGYLYATGKKSKAAEFIIHTIRRCNVGTTIISILPDVLRSGSQYENWRKEVLCHSSIISLEPYGLFDKKVDIDVFMLKLTVENHLDQQRKWPVSTHTKGKKVIDYFDVSVGKLVPHRHKKVGQKYSYIHPRVVTPWTTMSFFKETRRYNGVPFTPPFVVIRRTSRPGDKYRAVATVIEGTEPIAVENHLIVCKPKNGGLYACKELMLTLRSEKVNKFLDARIRCRHLTVESVRSIPLELQCLM